MSVPLHVACCACRSLCPSFSDLSLSVCLMAASLSLFLWSLPLSRCLSLCLSPTRSLTCTLPPVVTDGPRAPAPSCSPVRAEPPSPCSAEKGQVQSCCRAPDTLQNCLPSMEAESRNNEKLSVNSHLLPPALLQTGFFAFSLDVNLNTPPPRLLSKILISLHHRSGPLES